MPRPENIDDDFSHLPQVDDEKSAKADLWKQAKELADAKRGMVPPAPPPRQAPPPPPKRKLKLRVPPGSRATTAPPAAEPALEPEVFVEEVFEAQPQVEEVLDEAPAPEVPEEVPVIETKATPEDEPKAEVKAEKAPKDAKPEEKAEDKAESDARLAKEKRKAKKTKKRDEADKPKPEAEGEEEHHVIMLDEGMEEEDEEAELTTKERFRRLWVQIGGQSLSVSVGLHILLALVSLFIVFTYNRQERIDFLPGGGTLQGQEASQALENKVTRRRNQWLNRSVPLQRVAVKNALSQISLPEQDLDLQLPMNRDFMPGAKTLGGGLGDGAGLGTKGGMTFKPITLFGREIIGKRMAVVLDVSASMTPYLEAVVKEVDRVARGSPVVLYYGCGVEPVRGRMTLDEKAYRTQERGFEKFWRYMREDPTKKPGAMPDVDVYRFFNRRVNTFYVEQNGVEYAWTALINDLVRSADALYWFSDFEDPVNDKQLSVVLENLNLRKQRLYIHPQLHGHFFDDVRDKLAIPSGGAVIEPKEEKK